MVITKAVIPAAGLGTRLLPATKAQPKEMLPVVDKPVLHYVVEEAVESGIEDILIITGRGKRAIVDYFDAYPELENHLLENGKLDLLEELRRITELANIYYVRQKNPRGLGDALLYAERFVGDEPFAVLLGDDIIVSDPPCLRSLMELHERYGGNVIAVEEVETKDVTKYGIIDPEVVEDGVYRVKDIIEKPSVDEAPSNLATMGRYVLTPEIFYYLKRIGPGYGGEIQLTDALRLSLKEHELYAYHFKGRRYDVGDKFGFIRANIELALDRDDIGKKVREYLKNLRL
jgi:UTP--glucose-1-phosphate uridylyltransferase